MSEVQHFIKAGDLDRRQLYSLFTVAVVKTVLVAA